MFHHFSGNIEDVTVFDRALDAETLQDLIMKGAVPVDLLSGECGSEDTMTEEWIDVTPIAAE